MQATYSASLTNGSAQVIVANEDLRASIHAGYLLYVDGEVASYAIAAEPTFLSPNTTLALSANYAGTTGTKTIKLVTDYTSPDMIPLINAGDVHTATIFSDAMKKVQELLSTADVTFALQKANNLSDLLNAATARVNLGLGNVENKSSATIRSELTSANVTTALGYTPWHAGNDGEGSGLDADTLEGLQGSFYRNVTNMNAGILAAARMGTGTPTASTFLDGSNVWRAVASGDVTSALGYVPMNPAGASMTGSLTMLTGALISQQDEWGVKWRLAGVSNYISLNQATNSWDFVRAAGGVDKWRFMDGATVRLQLDSGGISLNGLARINTDSAGVLSQRDGSTNQEYRLFNRYDGVANADQEWVGLGANDSFGYFLTQQAGAGLARALRIGTTGAASLEMLTGNTIRWSVTSAGNILPASDNLLEIGSAVARVKKGFFAASDLGAATAASLVAGSLTVSAQDAPAGAGGVIVLAKSDLGTLAGNAVLGVDTNQIRIFENGGTFRGAYLDLTTAAANAGSKIWHSGNDGSGSGLDADLFRGQAPSDFAASASPTITGTMTADKIDASRVTEAFHDYGQLASGGTVTIEVDKYGHAAFTAPVDAAASFTIALSGIPAAGKSQTVMVEMINGQRSGAGTINYPAQANWMAGGQPPPNSALLTNGRNFFTVTFRDGGTRQEWAFSGVANLVGDVSSVGNVTTIPTNSIGFTKLVQIPTSTLLGRSTAGAGNIESLVLGTGLGISGGAIALNGTIPVTDDTTTATTVYPLWAAGSSGAQAEKVSSTKLSFVPSTGTLSASVFAGSFSGSGAALTAIPNAALVNSTLTIGSTSIALGATAGSLTGLTSVSATNFTGNLTGNVTGTLTGSITGNAATVTTNANMTGDVTSVGNATTIAANAVTFAKMADIATATLIGRSTAGTGDPEAISIGTGLSLSGGTLSSLTNGTLTNFSVTGNNGISAGVTNPTTAPALTLGLGDITPSSVNATNTVAGARVTEAAHDYGTIAAGGTVTIEVDKYGHAAFTAPAPTANFTIALSGIPASGRTQTLLIEIINGGRTSGVITYPAAAQFMGGKPTDTSLQTNGRNFYTVTIRDGGVRQEWSFGSVPDLTEYVKKAGDTFTGSTNVAQGQWFRFGHALQQDGNDGMIGAGIIASGLNIVGTQTGAGLGRQIRFYGSVIDSAGNVFWNAANLTNLNQLTNGPGYLTSSGTIANSNALGGIASANFVRGNTGFKAVTNNGDGTTPFQSFMANWTSFFDGWNSADMPSGVSHIHGVSIAHNNATGYGIQIAGQYSLSGSLWTRGINAGVASAWSKIWSDANDGSGSGLDADLLDGYHATGLGAIRLQFTSSQSSGMATASASLGGLEAYNNGAGGAAMMCFHRAGAYAAYFGLDTDNQWKVGGWSMGANAYKLWHEGNDGSGSGLDADLLDGSQAATAATASTIALRDTNGSINANTFLGNYAQLSPGDGKAFGFWDAPNSYGIWMSYYGSGTVGGRISGETTSDYNMYFRMTNGTNRGFVFENAYGSKLFGIHGDAIRTARKLYAYAGDILDTLTVENGGANGATIKLIGNSAIPVKYIRSQNGYLQVLSSAANASLFRIDDAGRVYFDGGELYNNAQYARMEWGSTSAAGTPYMDFHSSGNDIDYDFRILASGGSATSGQGYLLLQGLGVVPHCSVSPGADNSYYCGLGGARWIAVYAVNGTIQTSDKNKKENISEIDLGGDFIDRLKPRSFNMIGDARRRHGLIAQEIGEVAREFGVDFGDLTEDETGLNYAGFVGPIVQTLQETRKEMRAMKRELEDLRRRLH